MIIMVSEAHFLTEGIESLMKTGYEWGQYMLRPQVEIQKGVKKLVKKGNYTQVTAKEYENGARVVWLGGDPDYMFTYQGMRTLLRNAITWTIGYNLYKTWDNEVILIMDDPGKCTKCMAGTLALSKLIGRNNYKVFNKSASEK